MMKASLLTVLFLVASSALATPPYPKGPNPQLTPGAVCNDSRERRYPEGIDYCERNVSPDIKRNIIKAYDQNLGFKVGSLPRNQFKIDHYVPLCMGGSNEKENLWPQHQSVYMITDPLEQESCQKMADGKLLQAKAIELIKQAKNNLDQAPKILEYIRAL